MGPADYVMRTNALGTLNVNEAFYAAAGEGSRDRQRGIDGGPPAARRKWFRWTNFRWRCRTRTPSWRP